MAKCWLLQMPPTQKSVLISLADNANDQGECWPSMSTISERTCFSERAVQNAIRWLEANGLLLADRSNGRHSRYAITPEGFDKPPQQVHPRSKCAGAAGSGTDASPAGDRRISCGGPPQQVPSNRKEPSLTVKSNPKTPALDLSCWPSEPSPNLLVGWLAVRKKKRADMSEIVIEAMGKQLRLAAAIGWTVDECLTECVLRNWQALKAEWLTPRNNHAISTPSRKLSAVEQVEQAIRERREREPGDEEFAFAQIGNG